MFAAEAARTLGLDDDDVEDLRLLVTELLGIAVDTGGTSLELTLSADDGGRRLRALGAEPLDAARDQVVDRHDVLTGLADIQPRATGRSSSVDGPAERAGLPRAADHG
jgi:hypothetical protein